MLKKLKNVEFSKRLLAFIEVLVLLCFCLTAAAVLMGDATALVALITGVFSLASVAFGFYFWKARSENIRKYAKDIKPEDAKIFAELYKILKGDIEHEEDMEGD